MKRILALTALAGALGCSSGEPERLRAGAAAVDVTPEVWPLPMVGTFSPRPADRAHDPLSVRALVLDDGAMRLAIAIVDSCYVPREILDEAKQRASPRAGIPAGRMLVAATHTHSAPAAAAFGRMRWPPMEEYAENERQYSEFLVGKIAEAIETAANRLEPAEVGWAVERLPEEVFNRRWFMRDGSIPPNPYGGTEDRVRMNPPRQSPDLMEPAGPTDPEIPVLSVRTQDGKPLALLANYSLHYVGGTPEGQVSADYFGEFARLIHERLRAGGADDGFVGILSNGTSGDVNNIDFTKPAEALERFEKIRIVAGKTADRAYAAYQRIEHRANVSLAMAERELELKTRKPTSEGYERAKRVMAAPDESGLPVRAKPYAQRAIALYEGPETIRAKLQAIRIGELGIAAIPFEVFTEIGLEIKEKSPLQPSFTIELANGAYGYLPTPEQHELGGYETWLGTNRVEIEASRKITGALLDMFNEISGGRVD